MSDVATVEGVPDRQAEALNKRGLTVSPAGVRCVATRYCASQGQAATFSCYDPTTIRHELSGKITQQLSIPTGGATQSCG